MLRQVLRSGQQHGGVAVVAAGVHLALVAAGVGKGVEFLHGQRVHVGAQADGTATRAAVAPVHDAYHPGGAHAPVDGDAPFGEFGGHQVGGALLFKAQFGVGVDVAAQRGHGVGLCGNGVYDFHGEVLCCLPWKAQSIAGAGSAQPRA